MKEIDDQVTTMIRFPFVQSFHIYIVSALEISKAVTIKLCKTSPVEQIHL